MRIIQSLRLLVGSESRGGERVWAKGHTVKLTRPAYVQPLGFCKREVPTSGVTIVKLREPEARILALRIAASCPNYEAETAYIKEKVPALRKLGPADLKPSTKRKGECMWQQIVGNVVSHETRSTSIFNQGWAIRLKGAKGIRVTPDGIAHLKKLGWL